ncbi:MAG: GNAT family N-acetyltransferase [Betaproteobacteria bacterium]
MSAAAGRTVSGARANVEAIVRPISIADTESFRDCIAEVMRERRWLAFVEPFPLPESAAFVARNIASGNPHFVADDGGAIVGWCDIRREEIPSYAHDSVMGMGLRSAYRGRGLGERLLRAALAVAKASGFERVSLHVYAKNTHAFALYRKVGFVLEGTKVRGRKLDGVYDDVHLMAIQLTAPA